jgi:hypothetical protein
VTPLVNPHHRYGSVAVCFSVWVVVKPSPGRNSPCTPIKPSSAATPQGPRLRSLDLAPVSPAAGRGFLLAQPLRQASTKLGALSSLILWRRVGCSLIRSTHLRLIATLPRSSLVRILKQRFGAVAPAVKFVH